MLKINKAPGKDGIRAEVVNNVGNIITEELVGIIKDMLTEELYSDTYKVVVLRLVIPPKFIQFGILKTTVTAGFTSPHFNSTTLIT